MNKDQVEEKFRRLGIKPVAREPFGEYELFIGETDYSSPPHLRQQQFGIKPEEFPEGLYATWFWIGKDERLFFGSPSFYSATNTTQLTRTNDVRSRASMELGRMLKAQKERGH